MTGKKPPGGRKLVRMKTIGLAVRDEMKHAMRRFLQLALISFVSSCGSRLTAAEDTFRPYREPDQVPRTVEDLWAAFDPRREPLEVQIHKQWKSEGVVTRYVTFKIGTFKGVDARIAAYYAFPDNGKSNPALVWSHGGGQRAERNRAVYFAKQGFACVDINWLGRPLEDGLEANTDWGRVDPTQGPRFYAKALRSQWKLNLQPDEFSLDPVPSPRNSNWFLLVVAARRAITFLEQQPEVDPDRLGFSGYSMGGMITALTAIDSRLKAVVPFVGGSGFKHIDFPGGIRGSSVRQQLKNLELYQATIDASAYWPLVRCPVAFVTSSNDFHSTFERIYQSLNLLQHDAWRVTANVHQNHGPGPEQWALLILWLRQYLSRVDQDIPRTPASDLEITEGFARFGVTPGHPERLVATEIYFSYDPNARTRFWNRAEAVRVDQRWETRLAVHDELPLYVFALCRYRLAEPLTLERGETSTFTLNSVERVVMPKAVSLDALASLPKHGGLIDDFAHGLRDWSSRDQRTIRTYKFQQPTLDSRNEKQLAVTINPGGRRLRLRLAASSKFLSQENNLGDFTYSRSVEGSGDQVIVIRRDEFEGPTGKTLEWAKIAAFDLTLIDPRTRAKLILDSPQGVAYLKRIELVDVP